MTERCDEAVAASPVALYHGVDLVAAVFAAESEAVIFLPCSGEVLLASAVAVKEVASAAPSQCPDSLGPAGAELASALHGFGIADPCLSAESNS